MAPPDSLVDLCTGDQHMAQGVLKLRQDLELLRGAPPRVAVLAHNSHVGDGRATASA